MNPRSLARTRELCSCLVRRKSAKHPRHLPSGLLWARSDNLPVVPEVTAPKKTLLYSILLVVNNDRTRLTSRLEAAMKCYSW